MYQQERLCTMNWNNVIYGEIASSLFFSFLQQNTCCWKETALQRFSNQLKRLRCDEKSLTQTKNNYNFKKVCTYKKSFYCKQGEKSWRKTVFISCIINQTVHSLFYLQYLSLILLFGRWDSWKKNFLMWAIIIHS